MLLAPGVGWWGEARAKSLLWCCPRVHGILGGGMGQEMYLMEMSGQDMVPGSASAMDGTVHDSK